LHGVITINICVSAYLFSLAIIFIIYIKKKYIDSMYTIE